MNYTKLLEDYLTHDKDNKVININFYEVIGAEIKVYYYWYEEEIITIPLFDLLTFVYSKVSVS